jgi:hypothetical protein
LCVYFSKSNIDVEVWLGFAFMIGQGDGETDMPVTCYFILLFGYWSDELNTFPTS